MLFLSTRISLVGSENEGLSVSSIGNDLQVVAEAQAEGEAAIHRPLVLRAHFPGVGFPARSQSAPGTLNGEPPRIREVVSGHETPGRNRSHTCRSRCCCSDC